MKQNIILLILCLSHSLFAFKPLSKEFLSQPAVLKKSVLQSFKNDPKLLTLLEIKKWKSFPNRYVVFACFAGDSTIWRENYSPKAKYRRDPNCLEDLLYAAESKQEFRVQKNTELLVFDLDSLGSIHIRQRAMNITDPWMTYDAHALSNYENRSKPDVYRPECDCNSGPCCEDPKTLFDEFFFEGRPGNWSSPIEGDFISDQPFTFESLDLAPFRIRDSSVALGIRISASYEGIPSSLNQALLLFEPKGDSLIPVMASLMKTEHESRGMICDDAPMTRSGRIDNSIVKMTKRKNQGYKDLGIWEQREYRWTTCKSSKWQSEKSTPTLKVNLQWNPIQQFYFAHPGH